jgi:hypothetical protein
MKSAFFESLQQKIQMWFSVFLENHNVLGTLYVLFGIPILAPLLLFIVFGAAPGVILHLFAWHYAALESEKVRIAHDISLVIFGAISDVFVIAYIVSYR